MAGAVRAGQAVPYRPCQGRGLEGIIVELPLQIG